MANKVSHYNSAPYVFPLTESIKLLIFRSQLRRHTAKQVLMWPKLCHQILRIAQGHDEAREQVEEASLALVFPKPFNDWNEKEVLTCEALGLRL